VIQTQEPEPFATHPILDPNAHLVPRAAVSAHTAVYERATQASQRPDRSELTALPWSGDVLLGTNHSQPQRNVKEAVKVKVLRNCFC
jgi:hypothetical protein